MEYLAYLHSAFAYENTSSSELVSLGCLLDKAASPNWKRLSSKAWKYMLPLAITLSVLSVVGNALALEKGDRGPSVRSLQQQLRKAGFYQAPITQVYDTRTEDAVRRFQKAAGLDVNGVAGSATVQTLESWRRTGAVDAQSRNERAVNSRTEQASTGTVTKRKNSNILQKGDEGEEVKNLQERLRIAGFYYNNSTGVFGPITEEAVKRFQKTYNLEVDGVVGPVTLQKLPQLGIGYGDESPKTISNSDKLGEGDRGEAVRLLQEQLIKAGYLEGEPNGYYGPYTADAVRRFQADNYLAVSGIAGPTTRSKLHSSVNPTYSSDFSVLEIQRRLRDRGFYKGSLNGVMGEETKKAIRQAQQFYGISLTDVRSGRF